jgi:5'-3' exonuclease
MISNPYLLIDGDILVYRCGFAAQKRLYRVKDGPSFSYKKDLDAYIKASLCEHMEYDCETIIEPLEHALGNVKTVLTHIQQKFECGPETTEIWLSGPENFRDEVGVTRIYKGNRDQEHKPVHYAAIKDYLKGIWVAQESKNCEADDMLVIRHKEITNHTPVIVSTDKDLLQSPGVHYNWVKDELSFITKQDADTFFWTQMITGDPTDNVQGIPGMGEAKARKYLEGFDLHEYEEAVKELYSEHYFPNGEAVFEEHYKLLKIGQHEPQT